MTTIPEGLREKVAAKLFDYNGYLEKLWIDDPSAPYPDAVKWNDQAALTIADAILSELQTLAEPTRREWTEEEIIHAAGIYETTRGEINHNGGRDLRETSRLAMRVALETISPPDNQKLPELERLKEAAIQYAKYDQQGWVVTLKKAARAFAAAQANGG